MKTRSTFARYTEEHDRLGLELTPCAGFLYRELLRSAPAGLPQEFELEDFCEQMEYSLKWVKSALNELIEKDVVDIVKKYSGRIFKLVAWHPGRKSAQRVEPYSVTVPRTSKIPPSNAHSTASSYRDLKEITEKPTLHPVSTDEREKIITPSMTRLTDPILEPELKTEPIKPEPEAELELEIKPEIIQKIQAAGFKLNRTLKIMVSYAEAQIVLDAIEAAQQYLTKTKQEKQSLKREPEAVLVSAIKNQWQPNKSDKLSEVLPLPDNFEAWYELARLANVARASSSQTELTRHPQGVLCIETHGSWSTFDEMSRCFPIAELEEMARKREEAMNVTSRPPDDFRQRVAGLIKNFGMP
jgi:hypothetical protein